jgi:hypothetical protein
VCCVSHEDLVGLAAMATNAAAFLACLGMYTPMFLSMCFYTRPMF